MDASATPTPAAPASSPSAPSSSAAPNTSSTPSPQSGKQSGMSGVVAEALAEVNGTKPPAQDAAQAEAKAEAARRKYKQKVDGEEFEEELTDEEVAIRLQKGRGAEKRMQEAAALRKQLLEAKEYGKKDPAKAWKDFFGTDPREFFENQIAEEYERKMEEAQLSPDEIKFRDRERQLQERESKLQQVEQQREQFEQEQLHQRVEQETEAQFVEALESSGLPKSRETIAMMAEVARVNLDHGLELTPQQLAAETKTRMAKQHQIVTRGMKGEALLRHLGDDVVNEVRRTLLDKVRALKGQQAPAPPPPQKDTDGLPTFRESIRSWRKL